MRAPLTFLPPLSRSRSFLTQPRRSAVPASLLLAGLAFFASVLAANAAKKVTADYASESNPAYALTLVVTNADPSGKPAKSAGFVHPGVLVNRAQLDEIKKRVATGAEPQKSAFERL